MRAVVHASSSAGNLYEILAETGGRLLIDPGVRWSELERYLDYDLGNIEGCCTSHFHADHSKSVKDVMRAGITVYAHAATFEALGLPGNRKALAVEDRTLVRLPSFDVLCFGTEHDCPGSLGFIVREKATGEYLLFATDMPYLVQRFPYPFTIIMLACSYDKYVLRARVDAGTINESLAKRLLFSHPSAQWVKLYLNEHCNLKKIREIHLLHMSGSNIHRADARKFVGEGLFCTVK